MNSTSYHFRIGSFECVALSDGRFNYPVEILFSNVSLEEAQAALRQSGLPVNQITTPYTCLLINTGDHRVLIDTGAGNFAAQAAKLFPTVDHTSTVTGTLVENLKGIGIQPEEIDIVIITHAHPDHVGGTLDASGQLVFANAQYFIHEDEWAFWTSEAAVEKTASAMVNIARQNLGPLGNQIRYIEHESEIVPGIQAITTPGHTPGHLVISVSSAGEKLLHIVDVALSPLHLQHPTWVPIFDVEPEKAVDIKRRICDQAALEQTMVFAHHFPPFPNLGHVVKQGRAWQWQPLEIAE